MQSKPTTPELIHREMNVNVISSLNSEGRRQKLKKYLIEEAHIDHILVALERSKNTKDAALIFSEQVIPYVMHVSIRITETFVCLLLQ